MIRDDRPPAADAVAAPAPSLPSVVGDRTTESVGYFEIAAEPFADWLAHGLGPPCTVHRAGLESVGDAVAALAPGAAAERYLCVPVGAWTALLTDGPLGTDVGMLPSCAARELGCRAIRAVSVDDTARHPARIIEVYGPTGRPPVAVERTIVAANDSGRWVFETTGDPYPFEDQLAYARRPKASRFTTAMLYDCLRALGVPIDTAPEWPHALMVERTP